jgi:hypothetical protein
VVTDFEIVATVMAALFVIGTGVGFVIVIALSAVRRHRELPPGSPPGPDRLGWPDGGSWPGSWTSEGGPGEPSS